MDSVSASHYVVYSISKYFSRQPEDIRCCPVCGSQISVTSIPPSKALVKDLEHLPLIPAHNFSRLYQCSGCRWWAVRESWTLCEWGKEFDFLVVGDVTGTQMEENKQGIAPWKQVLEDEKLYRSEEPLPDHLLQLFVGGKKQVSFCPRLKPGDKISFVEKCSD